MSWTKLREEFVRETATKCLVNVIALNLKQQEISLGGMKGNIKAFWDILDQAVAVA